MTDSGLMWVHVRVSLNDESILPIKVSARSIWQKHILVPGIFTDTSSQGLRDRMDTASRGDFALLICRTLFVDGRVTTGVPLGDGLKTSGFRKGRSFLAASTSGWPEFGLRGRIRWRT